MAIETPTNFDYLIEKLRMHLWDIDPLEYRYTDAWLRTALVSSVQSLSNWWRYKYLIDGTTYYVSRNSLVSFTFAEPPIIEHCDEFPVILMASIIIKTGTIQNASWNLVSWRDAEISYSAQEMSKTMKESLKTDWDMLKEYLKPPQKRLFFGSKQTLPGYLRNKYERDTSEPV